MGITYFQPTAGAGVVVSGTPSAGQLLEATGASAASWANGMVLQASTPVGGFALQNGTPAIITWTPPNDGAQHRFVVVGGTQVTVLEVGGAVHAAWSNPGAGAASAGTDVGTRAAGSYSWTAVQGVCQAGQAVVVSQSSALTAGAAAVWAEIWGS